MDNLLQVAPVTYMDEDSQEVLRAGIPLFELRLPKRMDNAVTVGGPFAVNVRERLHPTMNRSMGFETEWKTQEDAIIRFELVDKKGSAVAWLPDDPWWHNRIVLMDGTYNPYALHTREGMLSGIQVKRELAIMRDVLKQNYPIFKVMENGKEKCFFWNKNEAKSEIEDLTYKRSRVGVGEDGKIVARKQSRVDYTIEEGFMMDYRPEVKQLISQFKFQPYGWTDCPAFRNEYRPEITKRIKDERAANPSDGVNNLAQQVASLSPTEKAAMLKELGLGDLIKTGAKAEIDKKEDDAWKPRPKSVWMKMKAEELRLVLVNRGIEPLEGAKKEDLVDAIIRSNEHQTEEIT